MLRLKRDRTHYLEGELVVGEHVIGVKTFKVEEIRAVVMDDGAEAQPVPPAGGHVEDVDPGVVLGDPAAPGLQGLRPVERHLANN